MTRTVIPVAIAILAVLLAARAGTFAQDTRGGGRLFDDYGSIRSCDHGARLDNYAIQLQNEPRSYGYIVVYAPESASKSIGKTITDYLVDSRGISAKRLKTINAGFNTVLTEPRIQLWVVPRGVAFDVEKSEVNLEAVKGMLTDYQDWDGVQTDPAWVGTDEDMSGQSIGNVAYAAVDEILKAQKRSVLHVVAFNGSDAVPGAWRRVAESTVAELKRLGLEADRFKIAYGGQAKDTRIQLWILPKGETPPVKDPASEPAPAKAVEIGQFGEYELGYPKNEAVLFNRLLAVLREHPDMRACLIVRSEVPDPEQDGSQPVVEKSDEPVEPEPEPADLLKLVEKWKNELAAKHKIGPDRLVLLYSRAPEGWASYVEMWIVPPGRPLPDPNADPEEEKPSDVVKDAERRP